MNHCCVCHRGIYRDSHCLIHYMAYIEHKVYVNGQWWHASTSGAMDFFALPALSWQLGSKVSHFSERRGDCNLWIVPNS